MASDPNNFCCDAKGKIKADIMKKLTAANRDVAIPDFCYSFVYQTVQLEKDQLLGLSMKKDTVASLRTTSPFQGVLHPGDIIIHVNKTLAPSDPAKIGEMILKSPNKKPEVTVARLRRHMVIKPTLKNYTAQEGYDYEYKVLYLMRGMSLGLDIRDIEGKIFVAAVLPDSISAMSLTPGESIIEVENENVTSVSQCSKVLAESMAKSGYCRVTVEIPNQDFLKNTIRNKINTVINSDAPKDYEVAAELRPIVEKGLLALNEKDLKPILLDDGTKQPQHISFVENVQERVIIMDVPTRLLVAVPPPKKAENQTATEQTMQTRDEKSKD